MVRTSKPGAPAQAGRNSHRSLDAIASDLHRVDRQSMFEIGKLFAEARDALEHGEWKKWVNDKQKNNFPWTYKTALNYIAAHELVSKYETVSHLRVPARTIYALAELAKIDDDDGEVGKKEIPEVKGVDDPAMPTIIAALKDAGKKKRLTYTEANDVISFAVLRHTWGKYPNETLTALDRLPPKQVSLYADWVPGAIDALKRAKPDKEDAAKSIVNNCRLKHLERLYGGALPTWLNISTLPYSFDNVKAEHRPEIRRRLIASKEPLDFIGVMDLMREVQVAKPEPADTKPEPAGDPKPEPTDAKPESEPADAKPESEPEPDHKPVADPEEKQLAADRQYARNLVKSNHDFAQRLCGLLTSGLLTNLKRRETFLDALIRALLKKNDSSDGNDADPATSAEARKAAYAAAEEKAA